LNTIENQDDEVQVFESSIKKGFNIEADLMF